MPNVVVKASPAIWMIPVRICVPPPYVGIRTCWRSMRP